MATGKTILNDGLIRVDARHTAHRLHIQHHGDKWK